MFGGDNMSLLSWRGWTVKFSRNEGSIDMFISKWIGKWHEKLQHTNNDYKRQAFCATTNSRNGKEHEW
jgi:hypothetical protein